LGEEKDDLTVSAALDTVIAVSESPVELRRVVIPLIHADLEHGRAPWRRCRSDVVGLNRLLAVPCKAVEIPAAERPNLDRE
jgi:hypothetical protein